MFGWKSIFGSAGAKKYDNFRDELWLKETSIPYFVEYSIRKSLTICVKQPKGEVFVKSPHGVSPVYIAQFVESKALWIQKHMQRIEELNASRVKQDFSEGTVQLILGNPYRLCIQIASKEGVIVSDGQIVVSCKKTERTELVLKKWQAEVSRKLFMEICRPIIDRFGTRHNVYPSRIEHKFVKGYWGQCTSKGVIRLNIELIRAPKACIEYIITHELCHLVHQNHSADFWALVKAEMPDFKQRKELLERTISCKY